MLIPLRLNLIFKPSSKTISPAGTCIPIHPFWGYHQNWGYHTGPRVTGVTIFHNVIPRLELNFPCGDNDSRDGPADGQNFVMEVAMMPIVPDQFVVEGIHNETGRKLRIVLRNSADFTPNRLWSIVRHMPAAQQGSLPAFAECVAASGSTYAQTLAKILGDPDFTTKHSIVPGPSTVLKFDHLIEQYPDESAAIEFSVMHKRELDPALGKLDVVHFVGVDGAPYFLGDFNKARPTGVLDLAVQVVLRDIVWWDEEHVIAGPPYFWTQYLDDIRTSQEHRSRTRETIHRILYKQPLEDVYVDRDQCTTLGDVARYMRGARYADMQALEVSSRPSHEVYVVGPGRHVVRRGMGVVFDLPVYLRPAVDARTSNKEFLDRVFGVILSFKKSLDDRYPVNITIGLHLASENIPDWLLSRVEGGHLLQTNHEMTISERFMTGVFSIWPAVLYQGICVPGAEQSRSVNDRVVTGHVDIHLKSRGKGSEDAQLGSSAVVAEVLDRDSDSQSITSSWSEGNGMVQLLPHVTDMIEPIVALHAKRCIAEVRGVNALPARCALECFRAQDELFNHQVRCRLLARPFSTVTKAAC